MFALSKHMYIACNVEYFYISIILCHCIYIMLIAFVWSQCGLATSENYMGLLH